MYKVDIKHVEERLKEHMIFNRDPHSFMHVEWMYIRNSLDEIILLRQNVKILTEALENIVDPLNMKPTSTAKAALKQIKE